VFDVRPSGSKGALEAGATWGEACFRVRTVSRRLLGVARWAPHRSERREKELSATPERAGRAVIYACPWRRRRGQSGGILPVQYNRSQSAKGTEALVRSNPSSGLQQR